MGITNVRLNLTFLVVNNSVADLGGCRLGLDPLNTIQSIFQFEKCLPVMNNTLFLFLSNPHNLLGTLVSILL